MKQRLRVAVSIAIVPSPAAAAAPAPAGPPGLAREGSVSSLAPEFRPIKRMEIESPCTLTTRFDN
jgi:hypothetical protein